MIALAIENTVVDEKLVKNYFTRLVNSIFKILPMKESGESTLPIYLKSLQSEITGLASVVEVAKDDAMILQLVSILQYQADNPDCPVEETRREVFKAIAVCNKLKGQYSKGAD